MAGRYLSKNVGVYWRGTYTRTPIVEGPYYDEDGPKPWRVVIANHTLYADARRGPWILPDERTPWKTTQS